MRRYLKTWMALDLTLVSLDWMELFWVGDSNYGFARLGKASRAFRILRLFRLLRLIRMRHLVQIVDERIRSDWLMICTDVIKILLIVLASAHFTACAWYGIGLSDAPYTWVKTHIHNHESIAYRYSLSMHWSLAQFAGGMD